MNKITYEQIKCIHAIIGKLQIAQDEKQAMVSSFSEGRCTSSTQLTMDEARAMIQYLKGCQATPEANNKAGRMIGKIFYYAHEMGWTKKNSSGKLVADGKRVDEWMKKYSYLKKAINRYSYEELPKLVSQFEQVYKHFLQSI